MIGLVLIDLFSTKNLYFKLVDVSGLNPVGLKSKLKIEKAYPPGCEKAFPVSGSRGRLGDRAPNIPLYITRISFKTKIYTGHFLIKPPTVHPHVIKL